MVWLNWLPWRLIVSRAAKAHGFLDPLAIMARLQRFAQPSEVAEPIELLRAGAVFHARGLINSRVIQHNLDWVWPHWVERQYDPHDPAFVPRGFSLTHINLTHRNWTAVGLPDCEELPIVDPRGLVTPLYDAWSLDGWIICDDGDRLYPSRAEEAEHRQTNEDDGLAVVTKTEQDGMALSSRVEVALEGREPVCRIRLEAGASKPGWLVLALRPYNPEGISFLHDLRLSDDRTGWQIEQRATVRFDRPPDRHAASDYHGSDVAHRLPGENGETAGDGDHVCCEVGMATAAAMFRLDDDGTGAVTVTVPLPNGTAARDAGAWRDSLAGTPRFCVPDAQIQGLYDAAVRSLILMSPHDTYPGPYTYKRFWFRDAALIVNGLLAAGLTARAERALDRFAPRQSATGYFHSQEGEWDSNGEALWIMDRFCRLAGRPPKPAWHNAILRGARWIARKRLPPGNGPNAGLLPAGFSAEHLGPNDYYYWDDMWSVAGLRGAANMLEAAGRPLDAQRYRDEAKDLLAAIDRSLEKAEQRLGRKAMPAAPSRRLDAGAIGSLAAGYPTRVFPPDDPRLIDSVDWLMAETFVEGGFFQDMIHSGINAYLTLHVAQVLLRAGDSRFFSLIRTVADLASPTGHWPEAIHPRTLGGCMGDGQHVWAAAEWVLMLRNCFVREEPAADGTARLVLASGLPAAWLSQQEPMAFGPTPTEYGNIEVTVAPGPENIHVSWKARWHGDPPDIEVRLDGLAPMACAGDEMEVTVPRHRAA